MRPRKFNSAANCWILQVHRSFSAFHEPMNGLTVICNAAALLFVYYTSKRADSSLCIITKPTVLYAIKSPNLIKSLFNSAYRPCSKTVEVLRRKCDRTCAEYCPRTSVCFLQALPAHPQQKELRCLETTLPTGVCCCATFGC